MRSNQYADFAFSVRLFFYKWFRNKLVASYNVSGKKRMIHNPTHSNGVLRQKYNNKHLCTVILLNIYVKGTIYLAEPVWRISSHLQSLDFFVFNLCHSFLDCDTLNLTEWLHIDVSCAHFIMEMFQKPPLLLPRS